MTSFQQSFRRKCLANVPDQVKTSLTILLKTFYLQETNDILEKPSLMVLFLFGEED